MTETATVEATTPTVEFQPDEMSSMLVERLRPALAQFTLAKNSLKSDPYSILWDLVLASEDAAVIKLRDQIETLKQRAEEMVKPQVEANALTKEQAEALLSESRKTIKSLVDAGDTIREGFAAWVVTQVDGLDTVIKSRASGGSSNQTGISRPRVKVNIDGTDYDTFSQAAKAINAKVPEMHVAWENAAGKKAKDIEDTVTFEYGEHKVTVSKK